MIVLNLSVRRVDPKEERFPGWDCLKTPAGAIIGFQEVYLCEMQTDGAPFECPVFLTDQLIARHSRQELMAMMLESFARAVREATDKSEAA